MSVTDHDSSSNPIGSGLRILDRHVDVRDGALWARFDGRCVLWALDIAFGELSFDDERAAPSFRFYDIPLDLRGLSPATVVEHADDYSSYADEWLLSYFFSHHGVRNSRLEILSRSGDHVVLRWEGVCDPHVDEGFEHDIPFVIVAEVEFRGIRLPSASDVARVAEIFDIDGLHLESDEKGAVLRAPPSRD